MQPPSPAEYCLSIKFWKVCMPNSEWASWAQAVFSVLAILGAVGIAYVQHRQNLKQQSRMAALAVQQAISAPFALAERAIQRLELRYRDVRLPLGYDGSWGAPPGLQDEIRDLVSAFRALPLHTLPTYEAIHSAYEISDLLEEARAQLVVLAEVKDDGATITSAQVKDFEATIELLKRSTGVLEQSWRRAVSESGRR